MRALLLLPVVAGVQVMETHQTLHTHVDYEGMKTTLKELAAKRTGDGKIDDDIVIGVRAILEQVDTTLMNALKDDLRQQQETFDAALAAIHSCDASRNTWFDDVYPGWVQSEDQASANHVSCRQAEVQLCGNRNARCNVQDGRVSAINDAMCNYPSFSQGDSDEVNQFMNCFSNLICEKYEAYMAGRAECRQLCSSLADKTAECEREQMESENAFCDTNREVESTCRGYRECRKGAEEAFYATQTRTRNVESLLQTQRSALECLQCYGRAILDHSASLDHCDTPPDCQTLDNCPNIVYDTPPEFIRCTHCSELTPCGDGYRNEHYSGHTGQHGNWLEGIISRKPDQCVPLAGPCTSCTVPPKGSGQSECDLTSSGADVSE